METSNPSKEALVEEGPSEEEEGPVKSDPGHSETLSRVLRTQFESRYNIVDLPTPLNAYMSGRYKQSFAYHTLRSRLPVILTNVVDTLTRDKSELVAQFAPHDFEQAAREELKIIIGLISRLKYEMQTDKPFHNFTGDEPDREAWNTFISHLPSAERSFYRGSSLHSECYLHRKLYSFVENSIFLKSYDFFAKVKEQTLIDCMNDILDLTKHTRRSDNSVEVFADLLKINMWSNSVSSDPQEAMKQNFKVLQDVGATDENIVVNDAVEIWNCFDNKKQKKLKQVDVILDNTGYELFSDFVLAEYIIEKDLASKVRFHVKAHPWFVTDVTERDFRWTLQYLSQHADYMISLMGKKFLQFLEEGKFELAPISRFWTSPHAFYNMLQTDPDLYALLQQSKLVIFKGDLNYRKLLQDVCWNSSQETSTCLRGFLPTNICMLRRVKSEIICGLKEGVDQALSKKDPHWKVSGNYGVIQFVDGTREFGY
ncbi:damage-control phosphatase ARMT1 [Drosophila bipectinata]|uniref:damage-control phosphatase ARMT1 n=1 Tax=Drosophila bipectinata TaxID=42026 RepID=UPI001C8A17BB|nr:damage-control phosphatase ARMT1 [Drosophila bipectinata]